MISRSSPVWQLYRGYRRCEGERLLERLRELEDPHGLVRANVRALHGVLPQSRAAGVLLPVADVPLGTTERRILRDFERGFHAALASVATLDASIRAVATSAPRSHLLSPAYEEQRSRLLDRSPRLAFADQLRDAVLASDAFRGSRRIATRPRSIAWTFIATASAGFAFGMAPPATSSADRGRTSTPRLSSGRTRRPGARSTSGSATSDGRASGRARRAEGPLGPAMVGAAAGRRGEEVG